MVFDLHDQIYNRTLGYILRLTGAWRLLIRPVAHVGRSDPVVGLFDLGQIDGLDIHLDLLATSVPRRLPGHAYQDLLVPQAQADAGKLVENRFLALMVPIVAGHQVTQLLPCGLLIAVDRQDFVHE